MAYGQNPNKKLPNWLFFDEVMAKITKCFNYGNFHIHRQGFLRRYMGSKRTHKFPVRTHKIGTSTLNLDNHEKF